MNLTTVSRRAAIAWGAALIAAPSAALANAQCSAPDSSGMKRCEVNFGSDSRDAVRQLKPHWCWAACIQTIFATHGFDISQQQIVQKVFGNTVDESANAKEILAAIDGRWTNDHGKSFEAKGFILWDRVADFERPDALPAAVRELREETGYRATRIERLWSAYSAPGFCSELLHFFVVDAFMRGESDPDPGEEIETRIFSLDELATMMRRDELRDAKTQIVVMWALSRT